MPKWCGRIPPPIRAVEDMLVLAWRAQPLISFALVSITLLQGAVPLGIAWLAKMLIDVLASAMQLGYSTSSFNRLILVITGQVTLMLMNQMAPTSRFLNTDLKNRLTISIKTRVYEKIGKFAGIAYFENPFFHDTLRLAAQGAQLGPEHSLRSLAALVQGIITVGGFIGLLVSFNPLLATLVCLASLPQLCSQQLIARQRYRLASDLSSYERRAYYFGHLISSPKAAKEIRVFGLSDYLLNGLINTQRKVHAVQRKQEMHSLLLHQVLSFKMSLFVTRKSTRGFFGIFPFLFQPGKALPW